MLSGLAAAAAAGLTPVKVNTVLMRGLNDDEAPELLRYCLEHGYELRFIEQMPLDAQHGWKRAEMVTADEIFDSLSARVRAFRRLRTGAWRRPRRDLPRQRRPGPASG